MMRGRCGCTSACWQWWRLCSSCWRVDGWRELDESLSRKAGESDTCNHDRYVHQPAPPMTPKKRLPAWLRPAPGSLVANALQRGKSPWVDVVPVLWSVWVFITPQFMPQGYDLRWIAL